MWVPEEMQKEGAAVYEPSSQKVGKCMFEKIVVLDGDVAEFPGPELI